MDCEQVQMFVSITGASEDVARDKLQAHGGNLNAAINNFYNEGEPVHPPMQSAEPDNAQWMEEDEPPQRQPNTPLPSYPAQSTAAWTGRLPGAAGLGDRTQWMEENETQRRQPTSPFLYHPERSTDGLPGDEGFGFAGNRAAFRDTGPIASHARDSRQVSSDWRDNEETRERSRAVILESKIAHLLSQSSNDVASDEDEVSGPASAVFRARGDRSHVDRSRSGHDSANLNASSVGEVPSIAHNEGADIEEEMIRAAIEASRKETTFKESQDGANMDGGGVHSEEDDMAWAVSQSLKTAEEEKAMRRRLGQPGSSEGHFLQEGDDNQWSPSSAANYNLLNRRGSMPFRGENFIGESESMMNRSLPVLLETPAGHINSRDPSEEVDEPEEQPLLRRRSSRHFNPTFTPPVAANAPTLVGAHQGQSHSTSVVAYPNSPPQRNGDARQVDEWGGLSSEEQDEAVMLEAAMFGSLPEDVAARFRYPSATGGVGEEMDISDDGGLRNYARPAPLPPSPTVIAQRLLREQQDDEYLASLEADREKEARAQLEEESRRLKAEEAKAAAHAENKLRQAEELRKSLAAEELGKQLAAKRATLPEEPSADDEMAVTLMVRMPDGSRQGRRFRKSEHLQRLFDFIDVSGGVAPGSYRLVRQYPRKAFTDGEHDSSFHDLGLSSKHEVLMLELI